MVPILENGRHFEILRETRYFLNKAPKRDTHANVGACITIWKIVSVICPTNGDGQNCQRLWWAFDCQLNSSSIPTISDGTDSGCNLYSVTTVVFFWGKTMRTIVQIFYVSQRKVQHYKHCNRIRPFSFQDCWHIKTNTIATRVKSLCTVSYIVVNCRCSVSPNSMIIWLFGDAVRFVFIVLRPTCSASRWSMPCRLRTGIKVGWSARLEANMYLCDYLLDKWGLPRTSDFDVALVRWTSDIISLFRSLIA